MLHQTKHRFRKCLCRSELIFDSISLELFEGALLCGISHAENEERALGSCVWQHTDQKPDLPQSRFLSVLSLLASSYIISYSTSLHPLQLSPKAGGPCSSRAASFQHVWHLHQSVHPTPKPPLQSVSWEAHLEPSLPLACDSIPNAFSEFRGLLQPWDM